MCAKVGLTRLAECLAREVKEFGVSVFAIAPGGVRTAMAEEITASPWNRKMEEQFGMDPELRWTTSPQRAAQLCVVLASGKADGLSGRHLDVRQDVTKLAEQAAQIAKDDLYSLRVRV